MSVCLWANNTMGRKRRPSLYPVHYIFCSNLITRDQLQVFIHIQGEEACTQSDTGCMYPGRGGQPQAVSAGSFQGSWSVGVEILMELGYWGAVWGDSGWGKMVLHYAISSAREHNLLETCICGGPARNLYRAVNIRGSAHFKSGFMMIYIKKSVNEVETQKVELWGSKPVRLSEAEKSSSLVPPQAGVCSVEIKAGTHSM